ncbi:uncharacterized protein (TIGR00369 family) [Cupriavidus necator]|nr:uncharacterized protein (TIGR00369 family) [Cupriavidus necator]
MVDNVLIGSPVARALGVRVASLAPDHVELEMPFLPTNVTHGSIVHGGVIATLIDIAGAAAAASGASADEVKGGATSSLSIQYLAPARGAALRAVAVVVRRGRKQVVLDVSVYAEAPDEGVLVAKALMSSAMF